MMALEPSGILTGNPKPCDPELSAPPCVASAGGSGGSCWFWSPANTRQEQLLHLAHGRVNSPWHVCQDLLKPVYGSLWVLSTKFATAHHVNEPLSLMNDLEALFLARSHHHGQLCGLKEDINPLLALNGLLGLCPSGLQCYLTSFGVGLGHCRVQKLIIFFSFAF